MLILDTVLKSLEIVLTDPVTTNALDFITSYVDLDVTDSTLIPGENDGTSNDITPVTIIGAPGSSIERQIKFISITNVDTVAAEVSVNLNNNSTLRRMLKVILNSGDNLCYESTTGWKIIDNGGNVKTVVLTVSSTTLIGDVTGSGTGTITTTLESIPAGVVPALGSDATGDLYYNNAGVLVRLPIGSDADVLTLASGVPTWSVPAPSGLTHREIMKRVRHRG